MRWRKQFNLRDLIWLVLLFAVASGWWRAHQKIESAQQAELRSLSELNNLNKRWKWAKGMFDGARVDLEEAKAELQRVEEVNHQLSQNQR